MRKHLIHDVIVIVAIFVMHVAILDSGWFVQNKKPARLTADCIAEHAYTHPQANRWLELEAAVKECQK